MAIIGKLPFTQKIMQAMSAAQLTRLNSLINNLGEPEIIYLDKLSEANKGVCYARFFFNELYMNIKYGFFIYIDNDNCGFFQFQDNFEEMKSIEINPVTHEWNNLQEHLTVEEFRRTLDDTMETKVPDIHVTADMIDSDDEPAGKVLTTDGQGGASWSEVEALPDSETASAGDVLSLNENKEPIWSEPSGGLPEATKANQVLVSNAELGWDEKKSVPLADNLLATPVVNEALYSKGPTGGLADIATGEESYLQDVKGYSIIWNQLLDAEHSSVALDPTHVYIKKDSANFDVIMEDSSTINYNSYSKTKLFDLTLMFGGNDKIPFSLYSETEYEANGNVPPQSATAGVRFQRLFADVDLYNAPYDAGTPKHVSVTKLTETGRNLWDQETMASTGIQLLAGYRYEVYVDGSGSGIYISNWDGSTSSTNLVRAQRADGKYIWYFVANYNYIMTPRTGNIVYVGFVHSGNYCLTTGVINNASYANTSMDIPSYVKHDYSISNVSNLKGLTDSEGNIVVADSPDMTRVGSLLLDDYQSVMTWNEDDSCWNINRSDLPSDCGLFELSEKNDGTTYLDNNVFLASKNDLFVYWNENETNPSLMLYGPTIDSEHKPSGLLFYPLKTPVSTGADPFEPIRVEVDDMGQEYFSGLTYAPVNQISYYYENLKDKLANMKEVEIEPTSYNYSATPLTGLKINGESYSLVPMKKPSYIDSLFIGQNTGFTNAHYATAIGYNAVAAQHSVAVGQQASASGAQSVAIGSAVAAPGEHSVAIGHSMSIVQDCVSIGFGTGQNLRRYSIAIGARATSNVQNSIAIGYWSENGIGQSVSFDGSTDDRQRLIHVHDASKIGFRNANSGLNGMSAYPSFHYLSEYIQNQTLVENSGNYYIAYTDATDYKTFTIKVTSSGQTDISTGFTGVHLVVKLDNHVVVGLDLLPYDSDNTQAFTAYGIADSTGQLLSGYLDAYGIVHLSAPSGIAISEVKYNLR